MVAALSYIPTPLVILRVIWWPFIVVEIVVDRRKSEGRWARVG